MGSAAAPPNGATGGLMGFTAAGLGMHPATAPDPHRHENRSRPTPTRDNASSAAPGAGADQDHQHCDADDGANLAMVRSPPAVAARPWPAAGALPSSGEGSAHP